MIYTCPSKFENKNCLKKGDHIKCQLCWDEVYELKELRKKRAYARKHHKGKCR